MSEWLKLVLVSLAAFRVTRLLALDDLPLVSRPRAWLAGKLPGAWADLVFCPWCLGVYVSATATALVDRYGSVPLPGIYAAAVAALVGLISRFDAET